jgi:hypothetical protein
VVVVEAGESIVLSKDVRDVYEAKTTWVDEETERLYRLGHPHARPEMRRVVVIDDVFNRGGGGRLAERGHINPERRDTWRKK